MSKAFRDEEPLTKEKRRARKLLYLTGAIILPIVIPPGIMMLSYFSSGKIASQYSESPIFGIPGLYDALSVSALWLYCVFSSVIVIPIIGTWLDVRRSNLQHAIVGKVNKGRGVSIDYYDPNSTDMRKFYQADDEKLVMKKLIPLSGFIFPIIILVILLSILFYRAWDSHLINYDGVWISFSFLIFCTLVYNFCLRKRRIEFNRLEGTVTVPAFLFPWHRTMKFEKVQVNAYDLKFQLAIPYRLTYLRLIGDYDQAQEWWSFYVWYMDKNRPLPTGTLLDAYREKDYLRRREEGFPLPLYPATFDTPEWNGVEEKYWDKEAKNRYKI